MYSDTTAVNRRNTRNNRIKTYKLVELVLEYKLDDSLSLPIFTGMYREDGILDNVPMYLSYNAWVQYGNVRITKYEYKGEVHYVNSQPYHDLMSVGSTFVQTLNEIVDENDLFRESVAHQADIIRRLRQRVNLIFVGAVLTVMFLLLTR